MLRESMMRRLRRGDAVAQYVGTYNRPLWNPRRGDVPLSQMLFGPARGTYWLEGDEVHLLYEARGKQAVRYAGPIPARGMSPVTVRLVMTWPLWMTAATVAVVLGAHVTSGLSAFGLAIAVPPIAAALLLLSGRLVRWQRREDASPIAPSVESTPHGRVVPADLPLPPAVLAATLTPPRSRRDSMRPARRVALWTLLSSVGMLLVATFVLDPVFANDDVWSWSAVIVGVSGIVLLVLSGLALIALALVSALDD